MNRMETNNNRLGREIGLRPMRNIYYAFLVATFAFVFSLAPRSAYARTDKSTIQPLTAAEAKALVAQYPKKPRVIAIWSLDCSYCKSNMKQLAAEAKKRGAFELLLISVDSIEEAATLAKLQMELGAQSFKSYASNEPVVERFRQAIDETWSGEMPRTLFIGTDGSRYGTSGLINMDATSKWAAEQRR